MRRAPDDWRTGGRAMDADLSARCFTLGGKRQLDSAA